jgi:hypothetical protein
MSLEPVASYAGAVGRIRALPHSRKSQILEEIVHLLYVEDSQWNPDKEWGADELQALAFILHQHLRLVE